MSTPISAADTVSPPSALASIPVPPTPAAVSVATSPTLALAKKTGPDALNKFTPVKYAYAPGATFQLSQKEQLLCDVLLETNNLQAAINAVEKKFSKKLNWVRVRQWLDRKKHLKDYLAKRLSERAEFNITKEEYVSRSAQLAMSAEGQMMSSVQVALWKLVGLAKGFLSEQSAGATTQNFTSISIVQNNGEA